ATPRIGGGATIAGAGTSRDGVASATRRGCSAGACTRCEGSSGSGSASDCQPGGSRCGSSADGTAIDASSTGDHVGSPSGNAASACVGDGSTGRCDSPGGACSATAVRRTPASAATGG